MALTIVNRTKGKHYYPIILNGQTVDSLTPKSELELQLDQSPSQLTFKGSRVPSISVSDDDVLVLTDCKPLSYYKGWPTWLAMFLILYLHNLHIVPLVQHHIFLRLLVPIPLLLLIRLPYFLFPHFQIERRKDYGSDHY